MPPKGRDFTPQQKAAITRQYNKLGELARTNAKDKNTFIRYKKSTGKQYKLRNIEGVRTNQGIFYKYPGAKIAKVEGKTSIKINYRKMREIFLRFPADIQNNIDLIEIFIEGMLRKYKPDYILWSVNGYQGRVRYAPELFFNYANELFSDKKFARKYTKKPWYDGVFFGWIPEGY